MTNGTRRSLRRRVALIAGVVLIGVSGCATTGIGGEGALPTASPSASTESDESMRTAALVAAEECFPGIWIMDSDTWGSLLAEAGVLASESIDGTARLVAYPDGTLSTELIGWSYEIHMPPNPILGDQAPKTMTISTDSSEPGTYEIDPAGTITVTGHERETEGAGFQSPRSFSCEGSRLIETVDALAGEVVYYRRG